MSLPIVGQSVLRLGAQIEGVGGDGGGGVDGHGAVKAYGRLLQVALVEQLYASVHQDTLVGLTHSGILQQLFLVTLYQRLRIFVVARGAIQRSQYLLHLLLTLRLGIAFQVVFKRTDAFVIGIGVQFAVQFGVVESGLFLNCRIEFHFRGGLEAGAGVALSIHLDIGVTQCKKGVLGGRIITSHEGAKIYRCRIVTSQHVVAIAQRVVPRLLHFAALAYGHLVSRTVVV